MVTIREVKSDEKKIIDEIVTIHLNTFTGFFLTFMGRGFLRQMYQSYCDHEESGLLVAEGDGKTVGFLAYMAIEMKQKGVLGKPCPDYVDETVSMKVVRIIQGWHSICLI